MQGAGIVAGENWGALFRIVFLVFSAVLGVLGRADGNYNKRFAKNHFTHFKVVGTRRVP
jgi:uncharacterized membrane protein